MRRLLVVLLVALALSGCPKSDGQLPACKKSGDQCRLDKNLLGVCNIAPSGTRCAAPPCLVCTSQH